MTIEDIVDCGRLAATAGNIQPWEFVVVTDPEVLRSIAKSTAFGGFIAGAPACIVVICRETKYYLVDSSAAAENILLAARAHGLGSCWVAGDKKPYAAEICRLVGAPPGYRLISLIPIGCPAGSDLFRYKDLLLAKQQELTTGKSLAGSVPAGGEPRGDPVDMAAGETSATLQMRPKETDSKLLRAIEDALTRIRQERFGPCEECGQPISKARLEAVPWARCSRDCKEQQGLRREGLDRT